MSQNESSTHLELIVNLEVENAAWQALLKTLGEEERALVDGEADLLAQLNTAKLTQLQALSNLSRTRHGQLTAAGHTPDHAGMATWLAQHNQTEYLPRWRQLCEMEQQAQSLNQRIGTLIDLRLASTRQALNVLIHAATSQGGLYDQAGQSVGQGNGKRVITA